MIQFRYYGKCGSLETRGLFGVVGRDVAFVAELSEPRYPGATLGPACDVLPYQLCLDLIISAQWRRDKKLIEKLHFDVLFPTYSIHNTRGNFKIAGK